MSKYPEYSHEKSRAWFDRAHLPDVPPGGSLTGEMIEQFRLGKL